MYNFASVQRKPSTPMQEGSMRCRRGHTDIHAKPVGPSAALPILKAVGCGDATQGKGAPAPVTSPPADSTHLRRRSLVSGKTVVRRDGQPAKLQVYLSPLYFKPFFSYAVDLMAKGGAAVSPYPVIVSRLGEGGFPSHAGGQGSPCTAQRFLYFVAQSLAPAVLDRLPNVPQTQILSHYPRSELICDKVSLAVLLSALRAVDPPEWDFAPTTCTSREEYELEKRRHPDSCWVVKEDRGQQGQGIQLTYDVREEAFKETKCLAQMYIAPPLLMDGRRFDLRVYVLVTSYNPLRVFMAKDGAVHLCAERYIPPQKGADFGPMFRHLTNVAVNQKCPTYSTGNKEGTAGHIRSFACFNQAYPGDVVQWWRQVKLAILKSLAAVKPFVDEALTAEPSPGTPTENAPPRASVRCMELYGYDVIGDAEGKPYILEVNQFPSWVVAGSWFASIKTRLMRDMLQLCNIMHRYPQQPRRRGTAQPRPNAHPHPDAPPGPPQQQPQGRAEEAEVPDAVTRLEDNIIAGDQALFERLWPTSPGDPAPPPRSARAKRLSKGVNANGGFTGPYPVWASEGDVAGVRRALSLSNELFSGYARTFPASGTASLSHGDPVAHFDYGRWCAEGRRPCHGSSGVPGQARQQHPSPPLQCVSPSTCGGGSPSLPPTSPPRLAPLSPPLSPATAPGVVRPERIRRRSPSIASDSPGLSPMAASGSSSLLYVHPDIVSETME